MKYGIVFKCRMCGGLISPKDRYFEAINGSEAEEVLSDFARGMVVGKHIAMHPCTNGNHGICDIQGIRLVEE